MKNKIISLIICLLLLTACDKSSYKTITSTEAINITRNKNAVIIDVRTKEEYSLGHIKNAINNPIDSFNVNYDKDTIIIVYCASGVRSANAANLLINQGYTNVYNLDGGLANWEFELVTE